METGTKRHLEAILSAGLEAADPNKAVRNFLDIEEESVVAGGERFEADGIYVLSVGKAAGAMAEAADELLGGNVSGGLVVTKEGHSGGPEHFETIFASHPEPDERGVEAAARVREFVEGLGEGDLLLALVSGGASALLADAEEPITLGELKGLTGTLLRSGAFIDEINCVRKHISTLKGGGVAELAFPAKTLALLLSDVVGDDISSIASGLTAPDPTTLEEAKGILARYSIEPSESVSSVLGNSGETPKPGDAVFENVTNIICGGGRNSVEAAAVKAEELGYASLVLSPMVTGDCRGAASMYAAMIREVIESGNPAEAPCALVSGGEATVVVRGDGIGGPNQEFCLALAAELEGMDEWAAFAVDTDGNDGPTDAAGGMVDGETTKKMREAGVEPSDALANNDSRAALEAAGALVVTGPTGTNVNDLRVAVVSGFSGSVNP